MHSLIIDTCVYIDLARKHPELRQKLRDLIDEGSVQLLVPAVVLAEWSQHRTRVVAETEQSIRGKVKNARALTDEMPEPERTRLADALLGALPADDQVAALAQRGVRDVDALFSHPSTVVIPVTDKAKSRAVELALAKKAPFGNRNGMADALILLGGILHAEAERVENCIFVSSNINDFSSKADSREIHSDLVDLFRPAGIRFIPNIAVAMNAVEAEIVSSELVQALETAIQSWSEAEREYWAGLKIATGFSLAKDALAAMSWPTDELLATVTAAMEVAWPTDELMTVIKAATEITVPTDELMAGVRAAAQANWPTDELMATVRAATEFALPTDELMASVKAATETALPTDELMASLKAAAQVKWPTDELMATVKTATDFALPTDELMAGLRTLEVKWPTEQLMATVRAATEMTLPTDELMASLRAATEVKWSTDELLTGVGLPNEIANLLTDQLAGLRMIEGFSLAIDGWNAIQHLREGVDSESSGDDEIMPPSGSSSTINE